MEVQMVNILQLVILGISLGGVFALMASGLTLIFGVMKIVNLAHAALILVAAYLALILFQQFGVDPLPSILITMPVMFLLGLVIYRLLFARIADSARYADSTVLLTFALALVIEGVLGYFFTGIYRSTTPEYATDTILLGPLYIPEGQFYATVVSFAALLALWAFLRYTKIGYAIRATTQNRTAAQTVGVNVGRISLITFGIGTALAGASGSLVTYLFTFFPAKHWEWIGVLMALIVLGGMGSLLGSFVGALILSVAAAFVGFYFGPTWAPITFFLALFLILIIKPEGLYGVKMEV
jgi:branched-chain amino acid transport system permease protein